MRNRAGRALAVLVLAVLAAAPVGPAAANRILNITASVDAGEIGMEDTLTLSVTVETENITRLNKPEVPPLSSFDIVDESSRSQTSISIFNGKTTRSKTVTFTYILQPRARGTFTIGPVVLRYDNRTFRTDPIEVTVVEGSVKGTAAGPGGMQVDLEALRQDIFIRVTPSRAEVYEGEQVFLTYKLYSRLDIDSVSLKQNPSFPGFYIRDIFNATRLEYRKESVEDRMYTTSLLKKVALFPLNAGTYTPGPLVLETTAVLKNADLFEVLGYSYIFTMKSEPVEVQVEPLPPTSGPFSGVVGTLSAELLVPDADVQTGESVVCYLTLKSTGNLSGITEPTLRLSLEGRTYLSDTIRDVVENPDGVAFVKKFEYTLIPEERGRLTVDSPDFLYFDTATKNYVLTGPEPVQIRVSGENIVREKPILESGGSLVTGGLKFIKRDMKSLGSVFQPLHSPLFYALHFGLLLAAATLFALRVQQEKLQKNEALMKRKRARPAALRALKRSRKLLEERRYEEALDSLNRSLKGYLADKTGKQAREVSAVNAGAVLEEIPGMSEEARRRAAGLLASFTELKYSSRDNERDGRELEALHQAVLQTITDIERLR
jgi:hypothetical protein